MTEQMSKLLDFSQKLDITLLENIVGCMYTGTGDQVRINYYFVVILTQYCIYRNLKIKCILNFNVN